MLPEGDFSSVTRQLVMAPPSLTLVAWAGHTLPSWNAWGKLGAGGSPPVSPDLCCWWQKDGMGHPLCLAVLVLAGRVWSQCWANVRAKALHRFILVWGNIQILVTKLGAQMFERRGKSISAYTCIITVPLNWVNYRYASSALLLPTDFSVLNENKHPIVWVRWSETCPK